MNLDRIDYDILSLLQKDGRISNKDLAARNGVSASTCLERVRRLRQGGVLTGFHAEVDPKSIGVGVQAMIAVRHSQRQEFSFEKLREDLLQIPEVVAVYLLAGTLDYMVHVATRDVDHLRDVCEKFISRSPVSHIETSLILDYARNPSLQIYLDQ